MEQVYNLGPWSYRGYLALSVYSTECSIFMSAPNDPKAVFSRLTKPRVKIPLLVVMSGIKIDLTLEQSHFLFPLWF